MNLTIEEKKIIKRAFPSALNDILETLFSKWHIAVEYKSIGTNSFNVKGETLFMPQRVYYNKSVLASLSKYTPVEQELLWCIFTRHHDGFVRQSAINKLFSSDYSWTIPFVVAEMGDYVKEIVQDILKNLGSLNKENLLSFLSENKDFYTLTKSRIGSYWDCYYRREYPRVQKGVRLPIEHQYPGFQLISRIKKLRK